MNFTEGRLSFDRNQNQSSFRRAMYVLYDIKYLLSAVPLPELVVGVIPSADEASGRWSEPLRKGFMQGLHMLLSLLASMEVTFPIIFFKYFILFISYFFYVKR